MSSEFSVIVPVYDAAPWLRQCVDSILAQTFPGFELILVDDGSSDGSGAICDEYAARDGRVTALHQPNAGPTPARRRGLAAAGGEYICFADADDWAEKNWLETLHGHIQAHGRPDMLLFDARRDTDRYAEPLLAEEGYYDKARLEREIYPYMLWDRRRKPFGARLFPGYLWSKAFKRELIAAHFITDDRIDLCEDMAMSYECLYRARDAYICREKLYVYRYREQSNLHHYRPDYFRQMRYFMDYLTGRLGGLDPALDRQINAVGMLRLLDGMAGECAQRHSARAAAQYAGPVLDETGFAQTVTFSALPLRMRLLLALVKCRLYRLAFLLVRLRM